MVIHNIAVNFLKPVGDLPIIKDALHLTYLENFGAAFGMFAGNRFVLIGTTAVMIAVCIYVLFFVKLKETYFVTKKRRINLTNFLKIGLSLVIGGGIGNLYERIFNGFVVDYIHFLKPVDFAVFNFSDTCVTVSVAFFAFYILFENGDKLDERNDKKGDETP